MRHYAEMLRDQILIDRPTWAASPIPRHPDAAQIIEAYKAEATTCRSPGTINCPGFFFVTLKALFSDLWIFPGVCVGQSTLLHHSST
jgi:hypothetical protein